MKNSNAKPILYLFSLFTAIVAVYDNVKIFFVNSESEIEGYAEGLVADAGEQVLTEVAGKAVGGFWGFVIKSAELTSYESYGELIWALFLAVAPWLAIILGIILVKAARNSGGKLIIVLGLIAVLLGKISPLVAIKKVADHYGTVEWVSSNVKKQFHSEDYDGVTYELEPEQYTFEAEGAVHFEEVKMNCSVKNNTDFVWDNCLLVYSVADSEGRIVSPEGASLWMGTIKPGETVDSDQVIVAGNTGCKSEEALTFRAEQVFYTRNYTYADADEDDFTADLKFVRDKDRDPYTDYLYLQGTITNDTDKDWYFVTLGFDIVNEKGKPLKKDKDYAISTLSDAGGYCGMKIDSIKAGETVEIDEMFAYVGKKSRKDFNARFTRFNYYYVE